MLQIDKEFKSLIPCLSDDEYAALEASILEEGCRDAIVVWGNIIVDGHNRYEICTRHGISFKTVQKEFNDRDAVIEWMILNQFARRNINAYQRSVLALRLKPVISAKAKERQAEYHGNQYDGLSQNSAEVQKPIDTRDELAKVAGVSHDTITRVEKILELADDDTKEKLRNGEVSINNAYKFVKAAERDKKERQMLNERADKYSQLEPNFFCADCLEAMKKYDDNHFDLAIVDPPYGISADTGTGGYGSERGRHYTSEWDSAIPPAEYYEELFRISKNQIIWGAQYMIEHLKPGTKWVVWDKVGDVAFKNPYSKCELAWTSFEGAVDKFTYKQMGFISDDKDLRIHPTQKPVALYEWLLSKFAQPNDKILDTHVGSGSSLIACWKHGFEFVGYEIDKNYYDLASQRLAEEKAVSNG